MEGGGEMKNVLERKTLAVLVAKATAPKNRIRYAVATGIVVTLMGASTVLGLRASADGAFYRSTVDDMLLLNGRIVKDVPAALTGNQNAYIGLYSALIQYLDDVSLLKGGIGLTPGVSGSAAEGLKIIETDLQTILQANDDMAEGGAAIIALNSFLSRLSAMNTEGGNRIDAVRAHVARHGTGATAIAQITALDELNLMLRRVMTRLSRVVEAQATDASVVGEIKNDLTAMRARLRGLFGADQNAAVPAITEPAALRLLTAATEKVLPYYIEVEDRVDTLAHIVRTKEKAAAIPQAVEKIYRETVVLSDYADARRAQSDTFYGIAIALNLIAALLTTLFFLTVARKNREEAEKVRKENDALQDSIASLLDDVSGIAGGDLTGRAKVTAYRVKLKVSFKFDG
jgi:hypothetical protein